MVAAGYSNKQTADRGCLGINTVKAHIRTGYEKIGVTTRAAAVRWVSHHGFAAVPDTWAPTEAADR